jgi:predicted  nucleic acid-binding Zn-ribbon protein
MVEQVMFGKSDLVDSLNRDLARARDRRETLASDVTMLTSRIAELEARLSAENERRERERTASEIEEAIETALLGVCACYRVDSRRN